MYVNNNLRDIDTHNNNSFISPSGFTPIINPSNINYKDDNITYNKAIGLPTANPPMTLTPGVISPNWDWNHLAFYNRQLKNLSQTQLKGIGNLDITELLAIAKNGDIEEIKSKISSTDATTIKTTANMLGIKLSPDVIDILDTMIKKDQVGSDGVSVDNLPVKIVEKNNTKYLLYGLSTLIIGGIGYLIATEKKSHRSK